MYQPDENEFDGSLPSAPPQELIEVSSQRLKQMKDMLDENQFTLLSAAPLTGKTSFMFALNEYLVGDRKTVVFLSMGYSSWENIDENAFSKYFQCWAATSWNDVIQSKSTIYLLLDDIQVMFKYTEDFWPVILRLGEAGRQHIRVLMSARSDAVNVVPHEVIISDEQLQLSFEETRSLLQNSMQEKLTEKLVELLYEITSGRPQVLQSIITGYIKNADKLTGNHKSFVKFMTSSTLIKHLKKHPTLDLGTYNDEERAFIAEMLVEMNSAGVFNIPEKTPNITKIILSLKNNGAICDAEGGVRFSAPIFQMVFSQSIFLPSVVPVYSSDIPDQYTFLEMIEQCPCRLEPRQIKKFIEAGTERARREFLVALYAIACQVGQSFCDVVPFVGSAFGAAGHSLDISFDRSIHWAIDIMPISDTSDIPPHIAGFLNGGVSSSLVDHWAVLHFTHTAPDPSSIEQYHWYLFCSPDYKSGVLVRKGFESVHLQFAGNHVLDDCLEDDKGQGKQIEELEIIKQWKLKNRTSPLPFYIIFGFALFTIWYLLI